MKHLTSYLPSLLILFAGCAGQAVLKERTPVAVSARAPVEEPEKPERVEVKKDRIQVNEAIYFDTNLATIRPESHELLDEIARVIKAHPELLKIRVEGHTDSVGGSKLNLALSKRRATSVRSYLVDKGIDADRLTAEGFGLDKPIASNDSEDGRAKNRRVAFAVLDRDESKGDRHTKDDDDDDEDTTQIKKVGSL